MMTYEEFLERELKVAVDRVLLDLGEDQLIRLEQLLQAARQLVKTRELAKTELTREEWEKQFGGPRSTSLKGQDAPPSSILILLKLPSGLIHSTVEEMKGSENGSTLDCN